MSSRGWARGVGVAVAVMIGGGAGCAVTSTTCPTGTRLTVLREPAGRAQWCAVQTAGHAALPVPGRAYGAGLGTRVPPAMPGGLEGPFTRWFPDGRIAAHGRYTSDGVRSVPVGLWAFWHPSGQRAVLGAYAAGAPVGCFIAWDEQGEATTGYVQGDQLHPAACTPPPATEMAILEGRARPAAEAAPWADVSLHGFAGPNQLGANQPDQVRPEPGMTLAFGATVRARLGRLRLGPTLGVRVGDGLAGRGLVAGAAVGWALPRLHPRVAAEIGAELAAQRLDVYAERRTPPGTANLSFWAPLPAVTAGVELALSPGLAAVAGLRVDGAPARSVERETTYCTFAGCYLPVRETWQIGGVAYGITLGLRLLLR